MFARPRHRSPLNFDHDGQAHHHKSYHPYPRDNVEKVRRDEEEAQLKEAKEDGRMLLAVRTLLFVCTETSKAKTRIGLLPLGFVQREHPYVGLPFKFISSHRWDEGSDVHWADSRLGRWVLPSLVLDCATHVCRLCFSTSFVVGRLPTCGYL